MPYNGEDNNDYVDDEVVQSIEYVPFGEVFVEERNNIWNTPYLFNAKEFDEETGLYYYGARYYDSRHSLWISTDPMQEYRLIILGGTVPPRIILITLKNLLK
ncbi:RHS repeat-associated core domain-containing protein [Segatella copri]